ncbi:MAG: type III-A CRISPR-associated RAMP protein Csm5 [Bacilli bacterium]
MIRTKIGYKHTIHFETVTPVAVLNGDSLSPLSDYTVDPQNPYEALLLNHKMFEERLLNKPEMMGLYIKNSVNTKGNKTNHFLYDFLKNYYSRSEVLEFFNKKCSISGNGNTVELRTCIKDAARPYIPGSTLKGAFKSMWLYNWLTENPKIVDKIINRINNAYGNKWLQREINKIIEECLDSNLKSGERMDFSTLQITDAYTDGELQWYHCNRFHIKASKNNEKAIPSFIEAISKDSIGKFLISIENNKVVSSNKKEICSLKTDSLKTFFEMINKYAIANIEHEIVMTSNEKLSKYNIFLKRLKNEIVTSHGRSAWLPVGFGKSNFYQSIGLLIYQKDKKVFEKYIQLFKMGKKVKKNSKEFFQKEFPLTRNLTISELLPLGWIKLDEEVSKI